MKKNQLNRRNFLRGTGGVAMLSPLLSSIASPRAFAQNSGLEYVVLINIGYGSYDSLFFPQPTMAPKFQDNANNVKIWDTKDVISSSRMFAGTALERVADQVSIYQGLDRLGFNSHQPMECLTGSSRTADGWFSQSIDQLISKKIYQNEPFLRSLHMGGLGADFDVSYYLDENGTRRPAVAHANGESAVNYLFSSIGATPAETQAIRNGNLSLVGSVKEDYRALLGNKRLSKNDVYRLQKHMQTLAEMETQLRTKELPVCSKDGLVFEANRLTGNKEGLHDYLQTTHRTLSCGLTKVITISIRGGLHDFSHGNLGPDSNESQKVGHLEMRKKLFDEIGKFCEAMAADKDENGVSLLDRGMVMVSSDMGSGYNHGAMSFPALVVGGKGIVNSGKFIDYRSPVANTYRERYYGRFGQPYSRFLKSIMLAMGLSSTDWEMPRSAANFTPGFGEINYLLRKDADYWKDFARNYDAQMGLPYFLV